MRIFLLALCAIALHAPAAEMRLVEREKALLRLPERVNAESITVSPDGRHIAYVAPRGVKVAAVIDGREEQAWDWIIRGAVGFTPDSQHHIYQVRRRNKALTIIDGVPGKEYDAVDAWITSERGGAVAYLGRRDRRFVAVVNGEEMAGDYASAQMAAVSSTGRWAVISDVAGRQSIIVDGREGNLYDQIGEVRFSADGKHFAFPAKRNDRWMVVVDAAEGRRFGEVGRVEISSDGSRVGYLAGPADARLLIVDGNEIQPPEGKASSGPVFSPDGKRMAYTIVRGDESAAVVVDGAAGRGYEKIGAIRFSVDGRRIAYIAERGGRPVVVVDGREFGPYDAVQAQSLTFSIDGSHIAWVAQRQEKHFVVIDGMEGQPRQRILAGDGLGFEGRTVHTIELRERRVEARRNEELVPSMQRELFAIEVDTPNSVGP